MKEPRFRWFFDTTHQIPIYRFKDGYAALRKNALSFRKCHDLLAEDEIIVIFAEGRTEMVKQLAPLQQGFARIAHGALHQKGLEDVIILPVGVNFQDPSKGGGYAVLSIGRGLSARDFFEGKPEREALEELAKRLHDNLLPHVIHLHDLRYGHQLDRWIDIDVIAHEADAQLMLQRHQTFPDQDETKVLPEGLSPKRKVIREATEIHEILQQLIVLPLRWTIGLPQQISTYFSKSKVDEIEFYAPVRIAMMIVLFPLWCAFLTLLASRVEGVPAVSAPLLCLLYLALWKLGASFNKHFYQSEDIQVVSKDRLRALADRIKVQ